MAEDDTMGAPALGRRATRGVVLLAATTATKYGFAVVRTAVLARLLSPEDFGVFGLGVVLIRGLETVTALGPEKYLVQKKGGLSDELVEAAWTLRALLGVVVALIAWGTSALYAQAVSEPATARVLLIIAAASILRGFKSPGMFLAERNVRFGRLAVFESATTALEVGIVVALALTVGGTEALAWGLVAATVLETLGSYLVFPVRIRPRFERGPLVELLGAGQHFLVIAIGSFIMVQGDNLLVGWLLGAAALGHYLLAYRLCELPLQLTMQVTSRVSLSFFSRMQDQPRERRQLFLRALESQLSLLAPVAGATVALASSLVDTLYGDGWASAVPVLRALGIVTLTRGLSNLVAPYLIANGHFGIVSRVKIVEVAVFVVGVIVGAMNGGTVGAAIGAGAGYSVAALARLLYLTRADGIAAGPLARAVLMPVILTVLPAAAALAIDVLWLAPSVVRLTVGGAVFAVLYTSLLIALRRTLLTQFMNSLRQARQRVDGHTQGDP